MGVDVFFAISGLLITSQLFENSDLRHFYIRRAFRILPPALLYLAVLFVLHLTDGTDVLHCLTIQRNYRGGPLFDDHFWSLSLEEQFYLAWPFLLVFSGKHAPKVAFALILCVALWRPVAMNHEPFWYARTEMRVDGLLWGCVSAFWFAKGTMKPSQSIAMGCMLLAALMWIGPALLALPPLLICIAVAGTAQQPGWFVSRVLESKPLVWIGQRSYGIYLWQQLFIFAPVKMPLLIRLAATFVVPALLYRFMETPLRQVGRRLARPFTATKPAAVAEAAV